MSRFVVADSVAIEAEIRVSESLQFRQTRSSLASTLRIQALRFYGSTDPSGFGAKPKGPRPKKVVGQSISLGPRDAYGVRSPLRSA